MGRSPGVIVATAALLLGGCSSGPPPASGAAPSTASSSPLGAAQPSATPTGDSMLGPFAMGAKGTYPDGVGVQVTHIRPAGKNKITFVLLVINGSTTPVRAVDFIGASPGSSSKDLRVYHAFGQKPQWDVVIPAGRSEGEIFTLEAPRSALKDVTLGYQGIGHDQGDQEGIPVVFRGDMTP